MSQRCYEVQARSGNTTGYVWADNVRDAFRKARRQWGLRAHEVERTVKSAAKEHD